MLAALPLRAFDAYGFGHYLAPRGIDREHNGVDLSCYPGTVIIPQIDGQVTKLGYCYSDDLSYRYVQVSDADGNRHRYFYVEPWLELGAMVYANQTPIGDAQDIADRYPPKRCGGRMINHIHYEVMHPLDDKKFFNPDNFLKKWVRK